MKTFSAALQIVSLSLLDCVWVVGTWRMANAAHVWLRGTRLGRLSPVVVELIVSVAVVLSALCGAVVVWLLL